MSKLDIKSGDCVSYVLYWLIRSIVALNCLLHIVQDSFDEGFSDVGAPVSLSAVGIFPQLFL